MTIDGARRRFFILGPTASGKATVAAELARKVGGELISVDSMKIYRGMDIGTAKPSPALRSEVPFHLIDIRDPAAGFSVAEFVSEALAAERAILERGRVPIYAGGTALYVRGLTEGVFEGPGADWDLRHRHAHEHAAEGGPESLHARLRAVDPKAAARLHPNDLRRVSRALEVYEKTGRPISDLQDQWKDAPRPGRVLAGILWPRDVLYRRIDERVDRMIAAGLVDEARGLFERAAGIGREAAQALGYRELFAFFAGKIGSLP